MPKKQIIDEVIYLQFLNRAILDGDITFNAASMAKLPKGLKKGKRSAPTENDMKIIAANIDRPFGFFPFFLLFTGMRKSEALALQKADIDMVNRGISVTKSLTYNGTKTFVKCPKTESSIRVVPIIPSLYTPLSDYLASVDGDVVFPFPGNRNREPGGYIDHMTYLKLWRNYCDETGLKLTAHQLRHGTATVMFEAGVDMYTAQRILGHSNIHTTLGIYTELRNGQMKKSLEMLDAEAKKYMTT